MPRSGSVDEFRLDPRLERDTFQVGDLQLCRLLLMRNADYPWLVLVPRRTGIREIHGLPPLDRVRLLEESCALATAMESAFQPEILNVGKLGNLVPQLHLHHVARYPEDPAWPGPVWGHPVRQMHDEASARVVIQAVASRIQVPWQ